MSFLSKNLDRLIDMGGDLDQDLDLQQLCTNLIEIFGSNSAIARDFLVNTHGKIKRGALGLHLLQIIKCDSAVRDIQTTGHLAKFLSRFDVFRNRLDYRIVGLPHKLFDKQSQLERAIYFERGASLEFDGDLLSSPDVQTMNEREEHIFDRHS
jgi:hypothetical protein